MYSDLYDLRDTILSKQEFNLQYESCLFSEKSPLLIITALLLTISLPALR